MAQAEAVYPVQFSVDYPDRELDRLSTAFRIIFIIPIAIVLAFVGGGGGPPPGAFDGDGPWLWAGGFGGGGVLFLAPLLMILFRQKYPLVVRVEPKPRPFREPCGGLPVPAA